MKEDDLENRLKELRNNLTTDRLDMSYGEIINMYEADELIINPEFQRLFRWKNYQKTRFIESILLGIPTPPIFVAEDTNGKWELVDGLQRLSTVLSFFGLLKNSDKNNWVMNKGDLVEELEGFNKESLPVKFQRNIKRAYCRVEVIKWDSQLDMRYELFNRLNTGGSSLTEQEIRNCIFRGNTIEFNDYLNKMANEECFIELTDVSQNKKEELYLEELVLRFTALYNKYNEMEDNLSKFLTTYMKNVTSNKWQLNYEEMEYLFKETIKILKELNLKDVFSSTNHQFSSSYFDGIMIGIAKNIEYYKANKNYIKEKIIQLKSDKIFANNMGSNSGGKTRVQKRIEIALSIFNPES